MPMYNLIEYSDNNSYTSGSLWQFKKDEVLNNNRDLTADNFQSFKYKATLVRKTADAVNNTNNSVRNTKIVDKVSKQLLEIVRNAINQLQNSSWIELFIGSVYWNNYQTIPAKVINYDTNIYELPSASFQDVRRLFALAYDAANDNEEGTKDNKRYFLPKAKVVLDIMFWHKLTFNLM